MWRRILLTGIMLSALGSAVPASAATGSVVINEIMYNPADDVDAHEYLELHNPGDTDVSLLGMSFSEGIDGVFDDVTLPAGGYVVISPDAAATDALYGVTTSMVYTGKLSNKGEEVTLVAPDGVTVVDSVAYDDEAGWPPGADGDGPSLDLTNPELDNNVANSWAGSTSPTPGAQNSTFGLVAPGDPVVTPAWPTASETVTISVEISGAASADLAYRVMFGSETSVPMSKSGSTFSATIPAQDAGDLVRYRVDISGGTTIPSATDTIDYLGYVVRNPVTTSLPTFEWFMSDEDFADLMDIDFRLESDRYFPAIVAYKGEVFTGVQMKIRGGNYARLNNDKQGFSVELPSGYKLDAPELFPYPVDEFALKYDFTVARGPVSWFVFSEAGFPDYQTFYSRWQKNGEFYAQYRIKEKLDGTWRKANDLDDGQFWKALGGFKYDDWEKKSPKDGDDSAIDALDNFLEDSTPTADELWDTFDIPNQVNYWAVSAAIRSVDQNHHNKYLYFDDQGTGLWQVYPWDLDHTWGSNPTDVCRGDDFTDAGCLDHAMFDAFWNIPEFREMYYRRIRSLLDGPLAAPAIENLNAAIRDSLAADADEEQAEWGSNPLWGDDLDFLGELQDQRDLFDELSQVPSSQPSVPNIVINELHYSPLDGAAEFLELHNPTSSSVDLSGFELDAVKLTIPHGTILEAGGYLILTDDLPLYRANKNPGSDYLVIQYSGGLKGGGELVELLTPSGAVVDTVEYNADDTWPELPGDGEFSLELKDPALANQNAGSWHASVPAGGTPGEENSEGQEAADSAPPAVTYPSPTELAALDFPHTLGGTITDLGSGVDRLELVAVDLGAAGATGVPSTQLTVWDGTGWVTAPEAIVIDVPLQGDNWSFGWNPKPGGSGSYVIGLRAYDNEGNKWPADKNWQALVIISDNTRPTIAPDAPTSGPSSINWTGTASDDVAIRKVRMIVRHVQSNEYWNGSTWITAAQAGSDPGILLTADLSDALDSNPSWTYELTTERTGDFQMLHWAHNGSYKYSSGVATTVTR